MLFRVKAPACSSRPAALGSLGGDAMLRASYAASAAISIPPAASVSVPAIIPVFRRFVSSGWSAAAMRPAPTPMPVAIATAGNTGKAASAQRQLHTPTVLPHQEMLLNERHFHADVQGVPLT